MTRWRDRAACRYEDPELFFPIGTGGPAQQQAEQAKQVCRRCTVSEQCLNFAITIKAVGIWAGLNDAERASAKRRRQRQRQRANV